MKKDEAKYAGTRRALTYGESKALTLAWGVVHGTQDNRQITKKDSEMLRQVAISLISTLEAR